MPNSNNRNFIENSINKALKEIKKEENYILDLSIDRDTLNDSGSPDSTSSIFRKIDLCTFFIADISLINGDILNCKKTPNPNVLVELGYAVNKIGWERVICVFNKDFGSINDLPFDLRNRRVLAYETIKDKESEKKKLISTFKLILEENYNRALFSNELMDYYNSDIYVLLFRLIMDISKILQGYDKHQATLSTVNLILNYSYDDIREKLKLKKVFGFQIFKSYEIYTEDLCRLLEKIVPIKNFTDDYYIPIVRLINTLRAYNKALNRQNHWDKIEKISDKSLEYMIHHDTFKVGENRIILMKKINKNTGIVSDFGDFQRKDHIEALLNEYALSEYTLNFYSGFFFNLIEDINSWIDSNGGEFIIDQTQFEIK